MTCARRAASAGPVASNRSSALRAFSILPAALIRGAIWNPMSEASRPGPVQTTDIDQRLQPGSRVLPSSLETQPDDGPVLPVQLAPGRRPSRSPRGPAPAGRPAPRRRCTAVRSFWATPAPHRLLVRVARVLAQRIQEPAHARRGADRSGGGHRRSPRCRARPRPGRIRPTPRYPCRR